MRLWIVPCIAVLVGAAIMTLASSGTQAITTDPVRIEGMTPVNTAGPMQRLAQIGMPNYACVDKCNKTYKSCTATCSSAQTPDAIEKCEKTCEKGSTQCRGSCGE
jgi:hypothetical protein